MPITKESIKIMASENLTDYDDGGGMMSGNEIVSGNVNNMFPDISRLDRVYGRVSLRKAFIAAMTDDNDVYSGVHVILDDPPDDPNVSVTLFTRKDYFDHRTDARDRIESYVVQGVRYPGYLLTNQLEGARAIQIAQRETADIPKVGDVFYLVENEATSTQYAQYVRITDVRHEVRILSVLAGSAYTDIRRRVVICEIGDPLRYTFHGAEPSYNDAQGKAALYSTSIADAARYYGVKQLVEDVTPGTFTVKAQSLFNHLVPSAQAETPVIDITAGGQVTGATASGGPISFAISLSPVTGTKIYCGTGVVRGSLSMAASSSTWIDDRRGNIIRAGTVEGQIDYGTGIISFSAAAVTAVYTVSYSPAVGFSGINRTRGIAVTFASRAYNYTATLLPVPVSGSLVVDYMSQGNWYRLKENGAGELIPLMAGTGTGTYNMETGSVILTCGALPDVDSTILFSWSAEVEYQQAESTVVNNAFSHLFILPDAPVDPGSVEFSYDGVLVSDNGEGALQGVSGTIDYETGEIAIVPQFLKASAGVTLSINPVYRAMNTEVPRLTGSFNVLNGPDNTFFSIGPSKPDTLVINDFQYWIAGSVDGQTIPVKIKDVGGTLKTALAVMLEMDTGTLTIPAGTDVGTFAAGNGDILIQGALSGQMTVRQPVYQMIPTSGLNPDNTPVYEMAQTGWHIYTTTVNLMSAAMSVNYSAYGSDAVYSDNNNIIPRNSTTAMLRGSVSGDIVTDAVSLNIGASNVIIKNGVLYSDYNRASDTGTIIGSLSSDGVITLAAPFTTDVPNTIVFKSIVTKKTDQYAIDCVFRTPGAPLRPGSFYIQAEKLDGGEIINATASLAGELSSEEIKGSLNHETGVVTVKFGKTVTPASDYISEPWYNAGLVVDDSIWMPVPVRADTIKYNCVVYSYIPLDAELVGLDPVRLPQDGRVPIFRKGDVVVVHHTLTTRLPAGLVAGQQISLPRGDLDVVELYAGDGLYVPSTQYSVNMASGVITMADPLDLTGYPQPLTALHRREEMKLLSDVQINGSLTVTHAFEREYPANGTRVSGALTFGDLQSRVKNVFDQKTWGNVWSDTRTGDAATATYNTLNYPIVTTNRGAIPQRWALVFYSSTQFFIMGEQLGVIGEGYINQDCHPINPATNTPYFTVKLEGWGSNWAAGNVLRFETMAAGAPVWFSRVTLQGPVTEPDDQFTIHVRGDGN